MVSSDSKLLSGVHVVFSRRKLCRKKSRNLLVKVWNVTCAPLTKKTMGKSAVGWRDEGPPGVPLCVPYPRSRVLRLSDGLIDDRPRSDDLAESPKSPHRPRNPLQSVSGVIRLLLVTMMVFPQALMPRGDRKNKFFSGRTLETIHLRSAVKPVSDGRTRKRHTLDIS